VYTRSTSGEPKPRVAIRTLPSALWISISIASRSADVGSVASKTSARSKCARACS
jgi:hypothetical protein